MDPRAPARERLRRALEHPAVELVLALPRSFRKRLVLIVSFTAAATAACAAGTTDPVAPVLLSLVILLSAAKLGGHLASRAGQPPVLGELMAGVVLGNLTLMNVHAFEPIARDSTIDVLARIGVVILLFQVGLESTVREMLEVGRPSVMVALVGVAAPFALGFGAGWWLLPERDVYLALFLGATLTATSIGITARVLQDLGASRTAEARIVLGAAVIDDVLGLVLLSIVGGVIGAGSMSFAALGLIVAKALGFLVGALVIGAAVSPRLFTLAASIEGEGILLVSALVFAFGLAYGASRVGLAPIIGAYAAGLILEPVHFRTFAERGERGLEELVKPVASLLAPLFFVLMGMQVELTAFATRGVLALAALLTGAAVAGKLACALVVPRGLGRLPVAIGMLPRGEVGLIFAAVGRGLQVDGRPVVDDAVFSAIVMMVVVTTLITPPALKWAFRSAVPPPQ